MTYLPVSHTPFEIPLATMELLTGCPAKGNSSPVSVKISSNRGCPGPGASCKNTVSENLNSFASRALRFCERTLPWTETMARGLPWNFSGEKT